MKNQPPPDPTEPLSFAPLTPLHVADAVRKVQGDVAAHGFAVVGVECAAQLDPEKSYRSARVYVAPTTPLAALRRLPTQLPHYDAGPTPDRPFEVFPTVNFYGARKLKADADGDPRWAFNAWLVEPRWILKGWLEDERHQELGTIPNAVQSTALWEMFTGRAYSNRPVPPPAPIRDQNASLVDVLRRYCSEQGHQMEYLASGYDRKAVCVINPSRDALLAFACGVEFYTNFKAVVRTKSAEGVFEVTLRPSPFLDRIEDLFYPNVHLPPKGLTKSLFDTARQSPDTVDMTPLRCSPLASLFHWHRANRTLVLQEAARKLGALWSLQPPSTLSQPTEWFKDLGAKAPMGALLVQLIRGEELAPAVRDLVYRYFNPLPIPTTLRVPRDVEVQFLHALAHPPTPEMCPQNQKSKVMMPHREFRL